MKVVIGSWVAGCGCGLRGSIAGHTHPRAPALNDESSSILWYEEAYIECSKPYCMALLCALGVLGCECVRGHRKCPLRHLPPPAPGLKSRDTRNLRGSEKYREHCESPHTVTICIPGVVVVIEQCEGVRGILGLVVRYLRSLLRAQQQAAIQSMVR